MKELLTRGLWRGQNVLLGISPDNSIGLPLFLLLIYSFCNISIVNGAVVSSSSSLFDKFLIKCPGLPLESKWGIHVDCILTTRGVQNFDCSRPMPPETVALYSCQRYFKQISASSPVKLMRCDKSGRWTREEHFHNLKCEYECGKAHPVTKTLIINDRITTRQIWPWHALIYYKLDPWEVQLISETEGMPLLETNSEAQLIINELNIDPEPQNLEPNSTSGSSENVVKREKRLVSGGNSYHAYICGGTLISPTKILTAAHCLTNSSGLPKNPKHFTIILGGISNSFYTNRQDSSSQIIGAKELYISTAFNYDKFEADIGIISLEKRATLSNVVLPVCLPEDVGDSRFFLATGKHGEVIGSKPEVGRTALGGFGLGLSTQLKSKKLRVLPVIECSRNIDRFPTDREYCAGMSDEVICSGDSGGGMISSPNFGLRRRYVVQGIVSYARARQLCENYAVFTRVYKFMDWIQSVLNNENDSNSGVK